ncbi:hypothetical protein [Sutterella sp.]|uniref:hypothetical protein n=1 Tax=Sutterella sp. TaxID=1981025 RepID=UPI0026DF2E53|nr:hypothetical protein [Sutterella sp.]MDO5530673.1 hypothetical protein [Sutterella sp.]
MTLSNAIRSHVRLAALAVCCLAATEVAAATPDEVRARCRAENRPCVGLVLSGGAPAVSRTWASSGCSRKWGCALTCSPAPRWAR